MREVVFDVETTGLSPKTDRIVEIGCVELINHVRTGRTFHTYVNPQRKVDKGAEKVHGLNYEFLKKHPTFQRVVSGFLAFIGDDAIVAHNAKFDMAFINEELIRLGLGALDNHVVDTLEIARLVKPSGRHTLDSLCSYYKVDATKRVKHGALLDCELLADVYLQMLGGSQDSLDLVFETKVSQIAEVAVVQRAYEVRLTQEEAQAHKAFLAKSVKSPIWEKFKRPQEQEAA